MIELNQLIQLIAIAENKTVSKAAQHLHISQPALSRSLQKLENELHVPLFDHYKNRIVLNKNGELAVEYAKKIVADTQRMIAKVQEFSLSFQSMRIASCTPAPLWDIQPLINEIYDNIQVQSEILSQDVLMKALKNREVDIIITPFEPTAQELYVIPYLEEDLFLSLPENHRFSQRKEITFQEIDGETMLLYSHIGFWHDIHKKEMPHTRFLYQDERSTFNEIVKSSLLPSFTSNLSIKREGKTKNRILIPITDQSAHVTFYVVILKEHRNKYEKLLKKIENYYDF